MDAKYCLIYPSAKIQSLGKSRIYLKNLTERKDESDKYFFLQILLLGEMAK